jgi:hypothetical protein
MSPLRAFIEFVAITAFFTVLAVWAIILES